jgi:type II secretory pathway pseudopilin PulG
MTLIEILITVSCIALLAAFILPVVGKTLKHRDNARTASRMRIAVNAFELYQSDYGEYPADKTPGVVPPEMTDYFIDLGIVDASGSGWWTETTDVGGRWDWDNGYHFAYSVSIAAPTASLDQMMDLDRLLDDGVLETGTFRKSGTQYHYILEE